MPPQDVLPIPIQTTNPRGRLTFSELEPGTYRVSVAANGYARQENGQRQISAEAGGIFQPKGPEIFDTEGENTMDATALWPWLAAFGLGLNLVDVLLRRLRLFVAV